MGINMRKTTVLNVTLLALIFNYSFVNAKDSLTDEPNMASKQFEQTRRGPREEKSINSSQANLVLDNKVFSPRQRGVRVSRDQSSEINIEVHDFNEIKRIRRGKRKNY